MIAFIDDHRGAYGVEPICKVLPIAPSTYRAHAARRADPGRLPARARSDAALMVAIRRVSEANFGVYGVRKVWRQLAREGLVVTRCTVARLMLRMGLQGVVRGRKVRTTISNPTAVCPLDHVNRQFMAPRPNAEAQPDALFALPVTEADLIRHWTLDGTDLAEVDRRRGASNQLGYALQLCAFRYPGRLLRPGEAIPEPALMDELRRNRIVAPGPSVVERLVAAALVVADRHVAGQLIRNLSPVQTEALDALLTSKEGTPLSVLG